MRFHEQEEGARPRPHPSSQHPSRTHSRTAVLEGQACWALGKDASSAQTRTGVGTAARGQASVAAGPHGPRIPHRGNVWHTDRRSLGGVQEKPRSSPEALRVTTVHPDTPAPCALLTGPPCPAAASCPQRPPQTWRSHTAPCFQTPRRCRVPRPTPHPAPPTVARPRPPQKLAQLPQPRLLLHQRPPASSYSLLDTRPKRPPRTNPAECEDTAPVLHVGCGLWAPGRATERRVRAGRAPCTPHSACRVRGRGGCS